MQKRKERKELLFISWTLHGKFSFYIKKAFIWVVWFAFISHINPFPWGGNIKNLSIIPTIIWRIELGGKSAKRVQGSEGNRKVVTYRSRFWKEGTGSITKKSLWRIGSWYSKQMVWSSETEFLHGNQHQGSYNMLCYKGI